MDNYVRFGENEEFLQLEKDKWIFYINEEKVHELRENCGKWMYFFYDISLAETLCKKAIEQDVVVECKHSNELGMMLNRNGQGVCCFYVNGDDYAAHKRVIGFFIENNMIRKTKAGKYYNISFKYDDQTRAGEYQDSGFEAELHLADLMDLETGEWLV